jgi:hypothetical protein
MNTVIAKAAFWVAVGFVQVTSSLAFAQICNPPVVDQHNNYGQNLTGIGDGCTLSGEVSGVTINTAWIPHIGAFKSTFTSSCNRHDKCLVQIGNSATACHAEFHSNMRNACDAQFAWYQPVERDLCKLTAYDYYTAVRLVTSDSDARKMQVASHLAGKNVASNVNQKLCGTTPALTQLYAQSAIDTVNGEFAARTGRQPTIFEFFDMMHFESYPNDPAYWLSVVRGRANFLATLPSPPTLSFSFDASWGLKLFGGSNQNFGLSWKLNNVNYSGSMVTLMSRPPRYNTFVPVKGFLYQYNASTGRENMLVIDRNIPVLGSCGTSSSLQCNN